MKKLLLTTLALVATPLSAQIVSSGAQQVQGTTAVNRGNAVNVRLTDGAGVAVTSTVPTGAAGTPATDVVTVQGISGGTAQPISAASLPLPTGAATSSAQATANTSLTTINTTLGTPFQAGGSIGNTTFAATQSGTWNIGTVTTLPALPANQSTNIAQINAVTPLMGNGVTGTGSLRVTLASDTTSNTNPLLFNQSQVNGVAVATGNGVAGTGVQRVTLASDTTSNTNPLLINQSQVNGVAMLAGNGVTGTGSQRVTIASDNTAFTVNAAQATASSLNAQVVGAVATNVAVAGNPLYNGGYGSSATPTAVTDGRIAPVWLSPTGATMVAGQYNGTAGADGIAGLIYLENRTGNGSMYPTLIGAAAYNGTTWDRARGDTNGIVIQAGLSSTSWTYSNGTTGILSNTTTAVTIKTAAGVGVRNYVDSCQINTTAFTVSGPIALRDGAGGAVIWALVVPTSGFLNPVSIVFPTPLRSTANTLLEVVTTTANTAGTAWVNCQGHTGS